MKNQKRFLLSLGLTTITVIGAHLLTATLFESVYYLAQLLPILLTTYLLLAWMIYLRRDDFLRARPRNLPRIDNMANLSSGGQGDLPEQKISGEELGSQIELADGLVKRKGSEYDWDSFWFSSMYVLIWSALQLVAVSVALYYVFGIGASI